MFTPVGPYYAVAIIVAVIFSSGCAAEIKDDLERVAPAIELVPQTGHRRMVGKPMRFQREFLNWALKDIEQQTESIQALQEVINFPENSDNTLLKRPSVAQLVELGLSKIASMYMCRVIRPSLYGGGQEHATMETFRDESELGISLYAAESSAIHVPTGEYCWSLEVAFIEKYFADPFPMQAKLVGHLMTLFDLEEYGVFNVVWRDRSRRIERANAAELAFLAYGTIKDPRPSMQTLQQVSRNIVEHGQSFKQRFEQFFSVYALQSADVDRTWADMRWRWLESVLETDGLDDPLARIHGLQGSIERHVGGMIQVRGREIDRNDNLLSVISLASALWTSWTNWSELRPVFQALTEQPRAMAADRRQRLVEVDAMMSQVGRALDRMIQSEALRSLGYQKRFVPPRYAQVFRESFGLGKTFIIPYNIVKSVELVEPPVHILLPEGK